MDTRKHGWRVMSDFLSLRAEVYGGRAMNIARGESGGEGGGREGTLYGRVCARAFLTMI